MTRGFMFFLVIFAVFVLSGVAYAVQGDTGTGRALVWTGMVFGALAIVCELAVFFERWQAQRNRPRCLG